MQLVVPIIQFHEPCIGIHKRKRNRWIVVHPDADARIRPCKIKTGDKPGQYQNHGMASEFFVHDKRYPVRLEGELTFQFLASSGRTFSTLSLQRVAGLHLFAGLSTFRAIFAVGVAAKIVAARGANTGRFDEHPIPCEPTQRQNSDEEDRCGNKPEDQQGAQHTWHFPMQLDCARGIWIHVVKPIVQFQHPRIGIWKSPPEAWLPEAPIEQSNSRPPKIQRAGDADDYQSDAEAPLCLVHEGSSRAGLERGMMLHCLVACYITSRSRPPAFSLALSCVVFPRRTSVRLSPSPTGFCGEMSNWI